MRNELSREFLTEVAERLGKGWEVMEDVHSRAYVVHTPSGAHLWVIQDTYKDRIEIIPGWGIDCKPWLAGLDWQAAGGYSNLTTYSSKDAVDGITVKPDADPLWVVQHTKRRILKKGYINQFTHRVNLLKARADRGHQNLKTMQEIADLLGTELGSDYTERKRGLHDIHLRESWYNSRNALPIRSVQIRYQSGTFDLDLGSCDRDLTLAILETIKRHQARYERRQQQQDREAA
jgi:hypothetical protein